jgi:hypothetical protein
VIHNSSAVPFASAMRWSGSFENNSDGAGLDEQAVERDRQRGDNRIGNRRAALLPAR